MDAFYDQRAVGAAPRLDRQTSTRLRRQTVVGCGEEAGYEHYF